MYTGYYKLYSLGIVMLLVAISCNPAAADYPGVFPLTEIVNIRGLNLRRDHRGSYTTAVRAAYRLIVIVVVVN